MHKKIKTYSVFVIYTHVRNRLASQSESLAINVFYPIETVPKILKSWILYSNILYTTSLYGGNKIGSVLSFEIKL